ncbi:MAG: DUF6885 family protein [Gaiellales bacterium]
MSSTTVVTDWAERTAELHRELMPQKDNLCGAFWGALVLTAAGVHGIDQDLVAQESGTLLPEGGEPPPLAGVESRVDYRLELPLAPRPQSGTPGRGLAIAIERLSAGRLAAVPVAGPWTAETVAELLSLDRQMPLIANVDTGALWGASADRKQVQRHLDTGADDGPAADWSVGHFVNPVAVQRGRGAAIVTVRDTYPAIAGGVHLQPASRLAAALRRDDGREGGVLCVCDAGRAAGLERDLAAGGLQVRHWDNGTPERLSRHGRGRRG